MSISVAAKTRWGRRATSTLASTALIAAGFVALAGPANAAGNTIYVNANGADAANCGSQIVQCKSIQKGVDQAEAGDTVLVAPGTYVGAVNITKAIVVKGDSGAASTIIDGTGLTLPSGLVNITQPGGDVTLTGFTIRNQTAASGDNDAYGVTIADKNDADTITVSQNLFPALSPARPAENPYGINSLGVAAKQVISDNKFAGLWRGVLIEANTGPVQITDNIFEELIPSPTGNDDGSTFPPKAIYFLADGNTGADDQDVTGNTFRDFNGIGVSVRAGYDLGACTDAECDGTFSGTASNNTFQLDAPAATNSTLDNQAPAAFNVRALSDSDQIDLVLSGNVGTVTAPTQPIVVAEGDGTVNLTPGTVANKIVPVPAPTLSVPVPDSFVTNGDVKTFTATAENSSSATLTNARYDVNITGTKGIAASQLKLEYDVDQSEDVDFQPVPLTGTASAGEAITGFFGPAAGFTFPASTTLKTDFRLSFPDSATPPDTLTIKVDLDQVSTASGNPVINTLATSTSTTTVSDAPVASVSVSSAAAAGQVSTTDTTAVTATVKNSGGGVLANQTVTFTVDIGFVSATEAPTSTTTKTVTATTNASGVATAYVGSTVAGTQNITAKSGDVTGAPATKTYNAFPATLTLTPATAAVVAGTKQVFTATVTDAVGTGVPNTQVTFDNGDGPGALNKTSVQTDADGKASVTLVTATDDTGSGTLTANTVILGDGGTKTATYTVAAAPPVATNSQMSISAPRVVNYGATATVSGTLTDASNSAAIGAVPVSLFRRVAGQDAYTVVTTVTTAANGTASFDVAVGSNSLFFWKFAGTATHKAVNSAVVPVSLAPTVTIAATTYAVKAGQSSQIYGNTAPAVTGTVVYLQRLLNGKWSNLATTTTKTQPLPNGKTSLGYVFTYKFASKANYALRVLQGATASSTTGNSKSITVRVS